MEKVDESLEMLRHVDHFQHDVTEEETDIKPGIANMRRLVVNECKSAAGVVA